MRLWQYTDSTFQSVVQSETGQPFDVTGWKFKLGVKRQVEDPNVLFTVDGTAIDPAKGVVQFFIPGATLSMVASHAAGEFSFWVSDKPYPDYRVQVDVDILPVVYVP